MGYNKISSSCTRRGPSFLRSLPDPVGHNPLSRLQGWREDPLSARHLERAPLRVRVRDRARCPAYWRTCGDGDTHLAQRSASSISKGDWMLTFPLFLDGGSGGRETQRSALQVQVHPFNLSQLITQTRNPTAFCAVLAFYGDCPRPVRGPLLSSPLRPPSFVWL